MKKIIYITIVSLISCMSPIAAQEGTFNDNWKFILSDSLIYSFENYKPDSKWQDVTIPHDWSISFDFDTINGEANTGYLLGGIGWYSKTFKTKISDNQKYFVIFDGVYNNSQYWINGHKIAEHPYGYSPFILDLSNYMNLEGKENHLCVRVDHSHYADSRWYTGSGIYRDVKYIVTDKFYIPVWGTYITTPKITTNAAQALLHISLKNEYDKMRSGKLVSIVYDNKGVEVASSTKLVKLDAGESGDIAIKFNIKSPELWSVENPYRYKVVSKLYYEGKVLQSNETKFGIRTIKFDTNKGFFLNGKNMKIKGVCLHHCAGAVGAAVPRDVWKRRLKILKEGGCNAIRTAHNPVSEDFLDICDEMGFLVQEEFFDAWDYPKDKRYNCELQKLDDRTVGYCEHFQTYAESDLKNTMLRDRNHPCIIQWSIGNEIEWTYPRNKLATGFWSADAKGGYFWHVPPYSPERIKANYDSLPHGRYEIGTTAHKLASWVREMDITRPVIANCILPSVSYESGYIDALDMVGFSYRRIMYDYCHKHYPDKPIMGTENVGQWQDWKAVEDRDFISGTYLWTGIDYMGEVRRPSTARANTAGLIDEAGFKKPSYYMMKSLWTSEPSIALYSQTASLSQYKVQGNDKIVEKEPGKWKHRLWRWYDVNPFWKYKNGEKVIVEAYSNCSEITLYQNGRSLGTKYLADNEDHIYKWATNYTPGDLKAVGIKDGKQVSVSLHTAGKPDRIILDLDRTSMDANNKDVLHVVARVVDENGILVQTSKYPLTFKVSSVCGDVNYKLLGVDNGDATNLQKYQSYKVDSHFGKALFMIQSTDKPSALQIQAISGDLRSEIHNVYIGLDQQGDYPYKVDSLTTPKRVLSEAMRRNFENYSDYRVENNEFYTLFKFSRLEGFDYHGGDGTISRRDPSKIIKVNGKYYVWYTHRQTSLPPQGPAKCNDTIPSSDWDLSEIWYATSTDGFTWEEKGPAIKRPAKPNVGWRSVSTADILVWKGKYYLYYQSFMEASGKKGDYCPVSMSYADSPDGPWTATNKIIIPNGHEGTWDQYAIHDPYPLVHNGKIYLYYKSAYNRNQDRDKHRVVSAGLAIADNPAGPFKKCPLNPVLNSGHEVCLFPYKQGVAAICIKDGNEHNTIQYAEDWVNFKLKAITNLTPNAPSPYCPDAFTDSGNADGITWGLSHYINAGGSSSKRYSILGRFDCDLSLSVDDSYFKGAEIFLPMEVYFSQGLSSKEKNKRIKQE